MKLLDLPNVSIAEHGHDALVVPDRVDVEVCLRAPGGSPGKAPSRRCSWCQAEQGVAFSELLVTPREHGGPALLGVGLDAGVRNGAGVAVDDGDGSQAGQVLGESDRAHRPAGLGGVKEVDQVLRSDRSVGDDLCCRRLGQEQSLGDPVADGFEKAARLVLVGYPVIDVRRPLGEPMPKFVGKSEVLTPTRWRGRIEDHPVLEERDAITRPTVVTGTS